MFRFLSAEWLRVSRFWLPWVLLGALVIVVTLQVNAKVSRLQELETELATAPTTGESATSFQMMQQSRQYEATWLQENLSYPAIIGYAARLASDVGWFFVILLTAVMGAEDFTRQTLRSILSRGVGRVDYLMTRCLALWLAAGVGVVAITLLAAASGPYVHAHVTDDPISLQGLGEALLVVVRSWLACLPFVVATLTLAVLARHAGPALGVAIGLHFYEYLNGFVLPILAMALAGASNADVAPVWRWQMGLHSVTVGYNADVFLNWGSPFMRAFFASRPEAKVLFVNLTDLGNDTLLPTTPWRAVSFLAGYTVLFLAWAMWILYRRDVTYGT